MPLGEYRDRVVILYRTLAAADSFGERVETWPDPGDGSTERWAKIEAPAGSEDPQTPRAGSSALALRFRGVVAALATVDRVKIKDTADVYAVVGVWKERDEAGGWQTVAALSGTY